MERSNFGDNPQALHKPDDPVCKLVLKDPEELARKKLVIPVRCKPLLTNVTDVKEFAVQIEELVQQNFIRESESGWSSPAFMVRNHAEMVRKKPRMVIDYRQLNEVTVKNAYRLPNKDSLIARLRGSIWFSKFDCKSGFYQVRMDPESVKYHFQSYQLRFL